MISKAKDSTGADCGFWTVSMLIGRKPGTELLLLSAGLWLPFPQSRHRASTSFGQWQLW